MSGDPLAPGATIGILGGGQLGRMTAMAAARLGYRCHVYAPEAEAPAAEVAAAHTRAAWDDEEALAAFARSVDVVTLEWENVPPETVDFLARFVPTRPDAAVLRVTRDRLEEKAALDDLGVAVARFLPVDGPEDLERALRTLGVPFLVKTRRFGYDGKGQWRVDAAGDLARVVDALAGRPAIAEAWVDFRLEVSVVTARRPDGARASFDPVHNVHEGGILRRTYAPAPIPPELAARAVAVAERVAERLGVVGLLAVEMFVTREGEILVNELAPRPHNSGHWTIDACLTSQFEQHVRAVCGLPLGSPARLFDATMINLLGEEAADWRRWLEEPGARLHLYGKREMRPGRKMGHVTLLRPLAGR